MIMHKRVSVPISYGYLHLTICMFYFMNEPNVLEDANESCMIELLMSKQVIKCLLTWHLQFMNSVVPLIEPA